MGIGVWGIGGWVVVGKCCFGSFVEGVGRGWCSIMFFLSGLLFLLLFFF